MKRYYFLSLIIFILFINSSNGFFKQFNTGDYDKPDIKNFGNRQKNISLNPGKISLIAEPYNDSSILYKYDSVSGEKQIVTVLPNNRLWLPYFEKFISISPNDKFGLFVTAESLNMDNAAIWLVDLSTLQVSLITQFRKGEFWTAPIIWSPDSTQIAYIKNGTEKIELWRTILLTKENIQVTSDSLLNEEIFSLNNQILFWAENSENIHYFDGYLDMKKEYSINIYTGEISTRVIDINDPNPTPITTMASLPCDISQFSQNDSQWKYDVMQSCNTTIGSEGCALTSTAMVFRYYGVETSPKSLNTCMGSNACPMNWPIAASTCSNGKVSWNGNVGFSWSTLESEINNGHPVIIAMSCPSSTHFVVAINGSGSSYSGYTINDPWDGNIKSLSSYSNCSLTGLRLFAGTPWCGGSCNNPSPSSDQVGVYSDKNYCGNYKLFSQGEWSSPSAMGFANDSVSSVKVGGNVKAILCKDDNYLGACEEFTGDDADLSNNSIGDEAVSSMKVQSRGSTSGTWTANYYDTIDRWWDNNNSGNFKCSENVGGPTLDKNYGISGPCGMDGDTWIADYSATINFPSGNYVFYSDHDDGLKFWLNGENKGEFGSSGNQAICNGNGGFSLSGNQSLRALLREDGGDAKIKLTWNTDTSVCVQPPSAPSLSSPSNNATVGRYDNVVLSWNSISGATEYYAEFTGGPGYSVNSGWTSNTSYTIGSTFRGGVYTWRVKARNSAGEGSWSETRTLYRKYGTPSNLTLSGATQTQVNLSWNSSADAPGNIDGYRIYRNGSAIATVGSSTTSYTDSGLTCGSSYSYFVRAYKGNLESDSSETRNIATSGCAAGVPTLLSPANGSVYSTSYDLSFQWNSSSGATEYLLEWWGGAIGATRPCGWTITNTCHIGTVAKGTYSWHVKARNNVGESGWSETRSFSIQTQPSAPKLSNPANGIEMWSTATVKLAWSPTTSATGYFAHLWGPGVNKTYGWTTATTWSVGSLPVGTYQWQVKAKNAIGESAWSETRTIIILGRPSAPMLISPANEIEMWSTTTVKLAWNSSTSATGYYAHLWGPGVNKTYGWTTATTWSVGSLPVGTYQWQVRAKNATGESEWSETRTIIILGRPGAPKLSGPANGIEMWSTTAVKLTWNPSTTATGYYAHLWGPGVNKSYGWTAGTTWSVGNLPVGTYQWQVKAKNDIGESEWSETRTITILGRPSVPTLISPTSGIEMSWSTTTIKLTWGSSSTATGYYAHLWGPGVNKTYGWTSGTTWSVGVLPPGTYQWQVKAHNSIGESSWSEIRTITMVGDIYRGFIPIVTK